MKVPCLTLPQARLLRLTRLGGRLFRANDGLWYIRFDFQKAKRVSDTVVECLLRSGYIDESSGRETRDGERKFDLWLSQWRLPE